MLRPARTVRVTTKAEFDAALGSADQVVVEGDDELLSYAVSKAAGDPENRIDIQTSTTEIRSPASAVGGRGDEITASTGRAIPEDDMLIRFRRAAPDATPASPRRSASVPASAPGRTWVIVAVALLVTVGVGAGIMLAVLPEAAVKSPVIVEPLVPFPERGLNGAAPPGPLLPDQIEGTLKASASRSSLARIVQAMAWPLAVTVVATVAIVALYRIARQAIERDRNVEISWKVTNKVASKVVITKVRAPRAAKNRAVA